MSIFSRRFPTLLALLVLVLGLVGGVFLINWRQSVAPRALESPAPINPQVTNVTDRSFTVSWTTNLPTTGELLVSQKPGFGSEPGAAAREVLDDRGPISSTTHYLTVADLTSNTTYYFQIKSGQEVFDQQGSPFSVTTGVSLPAAPASDTAIGLIQTGAGTPAAGAIVYAELSGGQLLSALTTSSGNWLIPLSNARRADLTGWLEYDRSVTTYSLQVEAGFEGTATAVLTTGIDRPVPPIILGNTYDFRPGKPPHPKANQPLIEPSIEPSSSVNGTPSSLFNLQNLGPVTPLSEKVTLDNPAEEGEVITSDRPEFFGQGPEGTEIEVLVESPETIAANVQVDQSGRWSFVPPTGLLSGEHLITLRWRDAEGVLQALMRTFIVVASDEGPAFTATPSATPTLELGLTPTPTPTKPPAAATPTPSPTPVAAVPESGSLTPSLLLFIMGTLFIVGGVTLMRPRVRYE